MPVWHSDTLTKRQLYAFTAAVAIMLTLVFACWLAPIVGYTFGCDWALIGCGVVATAWGIFRQTPYAKKKSD